MCGRYMIVTEDELDNIREIINGLSLPLIRDDFAAYTNRIGEAIPTEFAPIITKNNVGICLENARWGFDKWDHAGVIINARSETLNSKIMFASLLGSGRCVVPTSGFFEWEKLYSRKRKYLAKSEENDILFMAGLWRDNNGTKEFVVITKNSTGEITKIHDRMPVILTPNQINGWLSGTISECDLPNIIYKVGIIPCDRKDNHTQISLF